jgi:TetR/AcrR family tetracycline transcriptional repressor
VDTVHEPRLLVRSEPIGAIVTAEPTPKADRGSLARGKIVAEALLYIDEEGLASFSMRNLSRRLGVAPNALYWHVSSREDLLAEVSNLVLAPVRPPDPALPWQAWLRGFADGLRRVMHEHPHAAPLITGEILSSNRGEFHLVEPVLRTLVDAGFPPGAAALAYNAFIGAVLGFVGMEVATPPAGDLEKWQDATRSSVEDADPRVYPTLVGLRPHLVNRAFGVRWESAPEQPLDASFSVLVDALTVGLEPLRTAVKGPSD